MPQFNPVDLLPWLSPWTSHLATFALVLARVSGLLAVGPLLGRAVLPWQARAGLAVVLTLSLTPLVGTVTLSTDWINLIPAATVELALGFLLGCGSFVILWSIPLAGRLLDQQHSLPGEDDDDLLGGSPISRWLTLWGASCFLLCSPINGHLQAVKILAESFQTCPLSTAQQPWDPNLVAELLQQSSQFALLLIAPALATLTLVNVGFGLLGSAGLAGISQSLGSTTRAVIAAVVLAATLSGMQQAIAGSVGQSLVWLAEALTTSH